MADEVVNDAGSFTFDIVQKFLKREKIKISGSK